MMESRGKCAPTKNNTQHVQQNSIEQSIRDVIGTWNQSNIICSETAQTKHTLSTYHRADRYTIE